MTKLKNNKLIKYKNDINTYPLSNLTKVEQDLFFAIAQKVQGEGTNEVVFKISDLKKLCGHYVSNEQFTKDYLDVMTDKLLGMKVNCKGKGLYKFALYQRFAVDENYTELSVKVSEDYEYLFNMLATEFTVIELEEFFNIKSKYGKILYRLLKQWRTQGVTQVYDINDLRSRLGCPVSYANKYFIDNIIKPAVDELKPYFKRLKVKYTYRQAKGKPLDTIQFIFTAEKRNNDIIEVQATVESIPELVPPTEKKYNNFKKSAKNKFNNIEQHEYDFKNLEELITSN